MRYFFGAEGAFAELVNLECILHVNRLIVRRNHCLLNVNQKVERLVQELLWLKLNLLVVHLRAQITSATLVRGNQIDLQLAALLFLSDDGQGTGIIEHVGESFGGEEASADESRSGRIPERIVLLIEGRDDSSFEISF
jgi:uncharacterized protein involved in tellurium resistance